MCEVLITDALKQAQKLVAHIIIHETNVFTNQKLIVEIQLGMSNLHASFQVCGAMAAAVLVYVKGEADKNSKCAVYTLYCIARNFVEELNLSVWWSAL